jgi:hypothetical protein
MPTRNAAKPAPRTSGPVTGRLAEQRVGKPAAHPVRDAADALCRTAKESCHQHERLCRILELGADDVEYQAACALASLADGHLSEQTLRYELTAAAGRGKEAEAWWHAANALWMASREYGRRHAASDAAGARFTRHGSTQFGEIALDYELEMSARLALKQAIKDYVAIRPDIA